MKHCEEQHCKRCRDSPVCPISGTVKASTAEEKTKWRQSGSEAGWVLAHCSPRGEQLQVLRNGPPPADSPEGGDGSFQLQFDLQVGCNSAKESQWSPAELQSETIDALAESAFTLCLPAAAECLYSHSGIDIAIDWSSYAMGEVTLHHNLYIHSF